MNRLRINFNSTKFWLILIILTQLGIGTITSSPVRERTICGPAKCIRGTKFHYASETIYTYLYLVNATTLVDGGPTGESGFHLSSKVGIKFHSPCDATLTMRDVQLWESHASNDDPRGTETFQKVESTRESLQSTLENFQLRFSYSDGYIEELCPESNETVVGLNIKRGILSAFQNTMRRLDLEHKGTEDDIHGRCKVEYKLGLATSSSLTLEKTKDIGSCGDKFGILSAVHGTPYHFGTLHQSMPAVGSTTHCQQTIDRNLISEIRCSETYGLKSLSRGVSGAYTRIHQHLKLLSIYDPNRSEVTEESTDDDDGESLPSVSYSLDPQFDFLTSVYPTDINGREPLQFHHDYRKGQMITNIETGKLALQQFCTSLQNQVSEESGENFESLVNVLRGLSFADLTSLNEQAEALCFADKKLFDDALEALGTSASVRVIQTRISKGDADAETIASWISSLSYIPRPDSSLMDGAVNLLRERTRDAFPQVMLSYSSLANAYCRAHGNCDQDRPTPIRILITLYERYLGINGCFPRRPREIEQMLLYLKGIGNFGYLSPAMSVLLENCVRNSSVSEIRVGAIDAFRRVNCNREMTVMHEVFQNQNEDSEVRIGAFINLMRCPTYSVVRSVKQVLLTEEVNQVGSFVWSYLKNLQETALPSKAELQGLVADEELGKKFLSDFTKFSRNFEISSFYDDFNLGVGVDSNLIFSQNSYLPRSAMLNLTVDLFGESVNVFEANLRVENFEHYIESLFGPNGSLRNNDLYSLISSLRRNKRAIPSKRKLKQLAGGYDARRKYYSDPTSSLSFKTFGNEIFFKRTSGLKEHSKTLSVLDPFAYMAQIANTDSRIKKSKLLLDSSYFIPTGIGLPLNLTAQAFSVMDFKTETKFDVPKLSLFDGKSEFKVTGKLKPSAQISVMGSMSLGTPEVQTGIKVKAQLRTSTNVEGTLHFRDTSLLKVEFGLPQNELEILEYKSDLYFMEKNKFEKVGEIPLSVASKCTRPEKFDKIFGLGLCAKSYFSLSPGSEVDNKVSPYFPLNGPAYFLLSVQKSDPDLLKTKIYFESTENENSAKFHATYNLEKLTETKTYGITYDLDKINKNLEINFLLPYQEARLKGKLENNGSAGELNLSVISNNVNIVKSIFVFSKSQESKYLPKFSLDFYNNKVIDATAELEVLESSFNGNGIIQLEVDRPLVVETKWLGSRNDSHIMMDLEAEYKRERNMVETFNWKTNCKITLDNDNDQEISINTNLEFSEMPEQNLGFNWEFVKSELGIVSDSELRIGKGPSWSDRNILKISHKYNTEITHENSRKYFLLWISQPSQYRNWSLETSWNTNGNSVESEINAEYPTGKHLQSAFALNRGPGLLTFVDIGWNFTLPNQSPLQLSLSLEEISYKNFYGSFGTNWFGQWNLGGDLKYKDNSRRQKLNKEFQISLGMGMSIQNDPVTLGFHIYNEDEKESTLSIWSEYIGQRNGILVGHNQWTNNTQTLTKHQKFYARFTQGQSNYDVGLQISKGNGATILITSDFNGKIPNIKLELKYENIPTIGTYYGGIDFKWDHGRDERKRFALSVELDISLRDMEKVEFIMIFPGREILIAGQAKRVDDRTRSVHGKFSWDKDQEATLDIFITSLVDHSNGYQLRGITHTPYPEYNSNIKAQIICSDNNDCIMTTETTWGKKEKLSGVISGRYSLLPSEEIDREEIGNSDEGEEEDVDFDDDDETSRRSKRHLKPYTLSLTANLSTTIEEWKIVHIKFNHRQNGASNIKTDFDLQTPEGKKDWSTSTEWIIPHRLKDWKKTRIHIQAKTPLESYQSFDLQAIIGQQGETDTIGTFGIYTDQFQYSIALTGTPKLDNEGSLGFEIVTSHPKYDKIHGSLSYGVGESSRLSVQLGWPNVVIGLDTGLEWTETWEGFQAHYTMNTPWEAVRTVNSLIRIEASEIELKVLHNEIGLSGKGEWEFESMNEFEIRFEASSPIPTLKEFRFLGKNSLGDMENYISQVLFVLNTDQFGYKIQGESFELEEEDGLAVGITSQIELDTVLYPTIRSGFKFAQRESKFNVDWSLSLREGPINASVELVLLDLFRFNEQIKITTPYYSFQELEINLTPAVEPEAFLWNIGLATKWKSKGKWEEAGFFARIGDQNILLEALNTDLASSFDFEEGQTATVEMSQLIHWYSPISWCEEFKILYDNGEKMRKPENGQEESVTDSSESDIETPVEEDEEPAAPLSTIPLKELVFLFRGSDSYISLNALNQPWDKSFVMEAVLPNLEKPISNKFETRLDLTSEDKLFTLMAVSRVPENEEVNLDFKWERNSESNGFSSQVELNTPFPSYETQSASLKYEFLEDESVHSVVFMLDLNEDDRKLETNLEIANNQAYILLKAPLFKVKDFEFKCITKPEEDSESENMFTTELYAKLDEHEIIRFEIESKVEKDGWPSQASGTITTTFEGLESGSFNSGFQGNDKAINTSGSFVWNDDQNVGFQVYLRRDFKELIVKANTPFEGYEQWKLDAKQVGPSEVVDMIYTIETPWEVLSPINGEFKLELSPTINKFKLLGKTDRGNSYEVMTSWFLNDWNTFDIHCDSKYSLQNLETSDQMLSEFLQRVPANNFLQFKLRNVMAPVSWSVIDSMVYYETRTPFIRLGSTIDFDYQINESLKLKVNGKIGDHSKNIELKSKFDQELTSVESTLMYSQTLPSQSYSSNINIARDEESIEAEGKFQLGPNLEFQSKLKSNYENENKLVIDFQIMDSITLIKLGHFNGNFDLPSGLYIAHLETEFDRTPLNADLNISHISFLDFEYSLNGSSSYSALPSAGFQLSNKGIGTRYKGSIGGHFNETKTVVTYLINYEKSSTENFKYKGDFGFEVPIPDYDVGFLQSTVQVSPQNIISSLRLDINELKYLDSIYEHVERSSAGLETEQGKLEVYNLFWPFGILKKRNYQFSGGYRGLNYPTKLTHTIDLYDLVNRDLNKVTGQLQIHTDLDGQEITILGKQNTKEIKLKSDYKVLENEFQQKSLFSWGLEDSWMGYELAVKNNTLENSVNLKIQYPVRTVVFHSALSTRNSYGRNGKISTELNLNAQKSDKNITSAVSWENNTNGKKILRASVNHPTLPHEMISEIVVERNHGKVLVDYSGNSNRMINVLLQVNPEFKTPMYYWNITSDFSMVHPITQLNMKALHSNIHSPQELEILSSFEFTNKGNPVKISKASLELFKELKKVYVTLANPEEYIELTGKIQSHGPMYYVDILTNLSRINPEPRAYLMLDLERPYFNFYAIHGQDLTDGIYGEGGRIDSRNFKLDISESYDNYKFSDLHFFLRMNHSRLVTSKVHWRPEIWEEVKEIYETRVSQFSRFCEDQTYKLKLDLMKDAQETWTEIKTDALISIGPFLDELEQNLNFTQDSLAFQNFFEQSINNNDFYLQDISGYSAVFADKVSIRFSNIFIKIREYRMQILGSASSTSEFFDKTLIYILEKIKLQYRGAMSLWEKYKASANKFQPSFKIEFPDVSEIWSDLVFEIVEFSINLSEDILNEISEVNKKLANYITRSLEKHKSKIFFVIHKVEAGIYQFIVQISDFIYEKKDEVMKSTFYRKFAELEDGIDELYKDIQENDTGTNIRKYYEITMTFLAKKLDDIYDYETNFSDIETTAGRLWIKFKNLEIVQDFCNSFKSFSESVKWMGEYMHFDSLIQDFLVILYSKGHDLISQTVLEAGAKYHQAKTRFTFDADKGIVEWEQKLPMPWNEFNSTPNFAELPEYKGIQKLKKLFDSSSSSDSLLETYYYHSSRSGVPLFDGNAMLIGSNSFITFNGKAYTLEGGCVHLLSGDLVDGNFTVSIQYREKGSSSHQIIVTAEHNTLIFDFDKQMLINPKLPQNVGLPIQMIFLQGYRDGSSLVVENPKKTFTMTCNTVYKFCHLRVSGWYSRKVAGLFGTMDYEPRTDIIYSNGNVASSSRDFTKMVQTWDVSDDTTNSQPCQILESSKIMPDSPNLSPISSNCTKIFQSQLSSLEPCFRTINPNPYLQLCNSESEQDGKECLAAIAYSKMCLAQGISVHLPSTCLKCNLNGEEMFSREMKIIENNGTTKSADVVFIVEAKDCNKNMWTRKKMEIFLTEIAIALKKDNFVDTRFAVVAFGGSGVYSNPVLLSFRNEEFITNILNLKEYFSHIQITQGNASQDIFGALDFGLKLNFRPSASKNFILLPCSTCQPEDMSIDYSHIRYGLLEQGVSLHVLTHNDVPFEDKQVAKRFFGLDNEVVYQKFNAEKVEKEKGESKPLSGNASLRKRISIPKKVLGYCSPLAFATNGTIFNGKKLQNKRQQIVKIFSGLFSKRLVKSAIPPNCESCYCGERGLSCTLCDYKRPILNGGSSNENLVEESKLPVIGDELDYEETLNEDYNEK